MELNNFSKDSTLVLCKFNKHHKMLPKKLELHLLRCPDRPKHYSNCFYNNLHMMPNSELEKHYETCPNKILLDEYLVKSKNVVRPNIPITAEPPPRGDEEESWDQPNENKTNVLETIKQIPNFMKPIVGLTKSQRKKYRQQAHQNFSNVDLSFNPDVTINERIIREASGSGSKME